MATWRAPFGELGLYTWRGERQAGPVNIVWQMPLAAVMRTLRQDGWWRTWARRRDIEVDGQRRRHAADVVRGNPLGKRMHVRLWELGPWTVGQAHLEVRRLWGHRVISQDRARQRATRPFQGAYEAVGSGGRDHDGRIFVAVARREPRR